LRKGETVEFSKCNPAIRDRTCGRTSCPYCVLLKDSGVYCPAFINMCNSLGLQCSFLGNASIDSQPPELIINSPVQDAIYDSRYVLFDLEVNEKSSLYYYNHVKDRGIWSRLCSGCYDYYRKISFKDGFNDITIKARDVVGNYVEERITFFVDSKRPRIRKTEPRRGYANGNFYVEFSEVNPEELILYYGNSETGYRNSEIALEDATCFEIRRRIACYTDVNLEDYDGEEIEYWFNLTDIADNSDESRHRELKVDTTDPVINSLEYTINRRYVHFNISITEENFDEVEYYDYNDTRPRWRRLCSRLKDGICERRKYFRNGEHSLSIQVIDEAGNSVAQSINFVIDY